MPTWNADPQKVPVKINGQYAYCDSDEDFVRSIRLLAAGAGFEKYEVYVDGEEVVEPEDAPDTFEGIDLVEVKKYDEAS